MYYSFTISQYFYFVLFSYNVYTLFSNSTSSFFEFTYWRHARLADNRHTYKLLF